MLKLQISALFLHRFLHISAQNIYVSRFAEMNYQHGSVLGWVTAWEHLVLLASKLFCKVSHFCFSARLDLERFGDVSPGESIIALSINLISWWLLLPRRKLDK